MQVDELRSRLAGTRFADLDWVAETGSTNADLRARAVTGAGECALVADHQVTGRGRLDRRWEAPPGASLLMSLLVRAPFPVGGAQLLGTALGVAAVEALHEVAGLAVGLKWPNDVVAPSAGEGGADLKLGGLLAEYVQDAGGRGPAVVLGIGVNVAWAGHGFPEELASTATAVDLLGGSAERSDLAVAMLARMDRIELLGSSSDACDALAARYRDDCVTIGRRVRVELPRHELVGTAVDVTGAGALRVRDDDGVEHDVTVGDVVHLRPA